MKIALFDYGVGNLHSLAKALEAGGGTVRIESDVDVALRADALVLPGVGAFGAAANRLAPHAAELRDALDNGMPCLGICLGMQLLFEGSDEGRGAGIGAIPGRVRRLRTARMPHIGWNGVETSDDPLFGSVSQLVAYFANSFVAEPRQDSVEIAWTEYATDRFPAAVRKALTWGVQFHPEKSGRPGLRVIRNFVDEVRR